MRFCPFWKTSRARQRLLLVCLTLLSSGPGLAVGVPVLPESVPTGYVLSGMPSIHQTYNACGPASIAQVLGYFGVRISQQQVSALTRASDRSYMTAQALVSYAPQVGMNARWYRGGSLGSVRSAVRHSLPLIVLQEVTWKSHSVAHWRVVTGYDDARGRVYLMDPLLGPVTVSFAEFLNGWSVHQGQFAALYPPAWEVLVVGLFG